jgi:Putative restriction endonuclease
MGDGRACTDDSRFTHIDKTPLGLLGHTTLPKFPRILLLFFLALGKRGGMSRDDEGFGAREVGPYRAEQFHSGDPYEISNGHLIECMPTGQRGAKSTNSAASLLGTDPDVESAGIDAGFAPDSSTLRAPDISIGGLKDEPGWSSTAPILAVEYADTGQNEPSLRQKIAELLKAGTKYIWVVRLHGPRCVEVHEVGSPVRIMRIGDTLEAPGALRNPVPVSAFYDPKEAQRLTLRNLLQREGYEGLDDLKSKNRDEGRDEGKLIEARTAVRRVLAKRKLVLSTADESRIDDCANLETLERWLENAIDAPSAAHALE